MLTTSRLNYSNFKIAAATSFIISAILLCCSFYFGKQELFLLLNNDLGKLGDFFFEYATYAGDGLLWIVWLIAILSTKRKHLLPLIISAFAFVTIFTQVCKQVILPNELRPTEAISNKAAIHVVEGVYLNSINSFPSGHTATAFTFALLIALLIRSRSLTLLCVVAALIVGYTRVYLAQHFPLDVAAGIMVAVVSVVLAVLVQRLFDARRERKHAEVA
jgi:membrane-associated phospholipid phosphatase